MASTLDLKLVLKHLSNGTLGENLCIICLKPLEKYQHENVFTEICKEDKKYCIADVLQTMCQVTLPDTENFNVCINCFMMASMAYKFYLLSNRSKEILNFYTDELLSNLGQIVLPEETTSNSLCISLPEILTRTPAYDFNLKGVSDRTNEVTEIQITKQEIDQTNIQKPIKSEKVDEDDIVVIIQETGEPSFLLSLNENEMAKYKKALISDKKEAPEGPKDDQAKKRKKRGPMTLKLCTRCPVKYRFIAKLKAHMKLEHNVDLFVCKVCQSMTEDEHEYHSHLKTHTNIHQCAICNTVFKKRDTIINHLKWHERMRNISETENAHICEHCGVILENEETLRQHYDSKHHKKFTCYYCGKMYKGEMSFEIHIKKHEANMVTGTHKYKSNIPKKQEKLSPQSQKPECEVNNKKKCMCSICGRYFVDERALLWHQRLHNNERPYNCDVCGRGFVSLNRRNQHALCAHTAPARRCPLCPALFHLRSMVNTHIKKVHLKAHKRRNRVSKHQNVYWRTEPVPVQELSVEIQNDILELQAANSEHGWINVIVNPLPMETDSEL